MNKNLLAIDTGLCNLGWSIWNKINPKIILTGTIKTKSSEEIINRIFKITEELENIIIKFRINEIVCEDIRIDPALKRASINLSIVKGSLIQMSKIHFVRLSFIQPTSARKNVFGKGNIKKKDIQSCLQQTIFKKYVQNQEIKNEHILDSIIVALSFLIKEKYI